MNLNEITLLLVHILRIPKLNNRALKIDNIFDEILYPKHDLVWRALSNLKKIEDKLPTVYIIKAEVTNLMLGKDESEINEVIAFIDTLYSVPDDQLMESIGINLLTKASVIASKRNIANKLDSLYTQEDMKQFLSGVELSLGNVADEREESLVQPLLNPKRFIEKNVKHPTGVLFWDKLTAGGLIPGTVSILLGPTGGGKTTISIQTVIAQIKREYPALLCSYEQPAEGDISERLCASMVERNIDEFRNKPETEWSSELKEKYWYLAKKYAKYAFVKDFTKKGETGSRGILDVRDTVIEMEKQSLKPKIVILDWLLPMVKRQIAKQGLPQTNESIRNLGYDIISQAGKLAQEFNLAMIINHQLDTKMSRAKSYLVPTSTDAMEWKSIAYEADACFIIGNRSPETNIAYFTVDKNRHGELGKCMVMLNGAYCRLEEADNFVLNHKNQFVHKDQMMPHEIDNETPSMSSNLEL